MKSKLQYGSPPAPQETWSDEELVEECLAGNQLAWSTLVSKYKSLVYSVPAKYRFSPEDAADIFQAVWMELYSELPRLRRVGAIRGWLATVAANKCFHWKRRQQRKGEVQVSESEFELADPSPSAAAIHEELIREQILREGVQRLPGRCRTMMELLFYNDPPIAYSDLARQLGLAEGSIGFIRGRCLKQLRRELEIIGF